MNAPPSASIRADELADLGQWLRDHDLRVDPHQLIVATRLLASLRKPVATTDLAPWLAPVFCTSGAEQLRFTDLYADWLVNRGLAPAPDNPPGSSEKADVASRERVRLRWSAWPFVLAFVALVAILGWQLRFHESSVHVTGGGHGLAGASVAMEGEAGALALDTDAKGRAVLRYRHWQMPVLFTVTHPAYVSGGVPVPVSGRIDRARASVEIAMPDADPMPPPPAFAPAAAMVDSWQTSPPPLARKEVGAPVLTVDPIALALCLALLLGPCAWWLFSTLRRRGFLERLPAVGDEATLQIEAGAPAALSAYAGALRYLGREMRRRRTIPSRTLDMSSTLTATMRSGGRPQLVFGARAENEYLVLVDRTSVGDHQARLADEIIRALLDQGIMLDRYEFEGDPRRAHHAPLEVSARHDRSDSLEQLFSRHPESRLVVFSDGAGLVDRYTGRPEAWISSLLAWPSTVLMTPQPRDHWGVREWQLAQTGIALLPLDGDGLHVLGEVFRQEKAWPGVDPRAQRRARPAYLRNLDLLLDRMSPPAVDIATLLAELRADLKADGFAWLAACAVYPEIQWGITLAVGDALATAHLEVKATAPAPGPRESVSRQPAHARRLAQLSRLPWLRWSFMPDWLRTALLRGITPIDEQIVRDRLASYLVPARKGSRARLNSLLAYADGPSPSPLADAWAGLRAWLGGTERREVTEDRIFLRFMSGPRRRLAVDAGGALERLFYERGVPLAGPRVWPLVVGVLAAAAVAWARTPVTWIQHTEPVVVVASDVSLLALDQDGSHIAIGGYRGDVVIKAVGGNAPCKLTQQAPLDALAIDGNTVKLVYSQARTTRMVWAVPAEGSAVSCDALLAPHAVEAREIPQAVLRHLTARDIWTSVDPVPDSDVMCTIVQGSSVQRVRRELLRALLGGGEHVTACTAAGNATRLIVATEAGAIRSYALPLPTTSGVPNGTRLPDTVGIVAVAANRDGSVIAAIRSDGGVSVLRDGATWTDLGQLEAQAPLALSADGLTLAFDTSRHALQIWRLDVASTILTFTPSSESERLPADSGFARELEEALQQAHGDILTSGELFQYLKTNTPISKRGRLTPTFVVSGGQANLSQYNFPTFGTAVAIGTLQTASSSFPPLPEVRRDVEIFRNSLQRRGLTAFTELNPNKAKAMALLSNLRSSVYGKPLVIYFTGSAGTSPKGNGLLLADSTDDPSTWLMYDELRTVIGMSGASVTWLFLDSMYVNSFSKDETSPAAAMTQPKQGGTADQIQLLQKQGNAIGIDISRRSLAQSDVAKLRSVGVSFVYVKASQGKDHVDPSFASTCVNARREGLLCGGYHFLTNDSPDIQAELFLKRLALVQTDLPPAIDFEPISTGPSATVEVLRTFIALVQKGTGCTPLLYGGRYLDQEAETANFNLNSIPRWIPNAVNMPTKAPYTANWKFWQFSYETSVQGLAPMDFNAFNGNELQLREFAKNACPRLKR